MALLSMQDVTLSFGGAPLLDGVNLQIEAGERVCLLGRNGAGKSTLMKLIRGEIVSDGGKISRQQSLRVAVLAQEVPRGLAGSVLEVVLSGLGGEVDWEGESRAEQLLSRMKLDGAIPFEDLSAGLKRRVLLARGLVTDPHILLLDEPTNHLDIESITWLEEFLLRYGGTLFFVTHDRLFLQRLATRIIELDRGRIINWDCDYPAYLARREALLEAEAAQDARFDKKLAAEEVWIRQGIKARRTRNEGRVRALKKMREERRLRREATGNVKMRLQEARLSGRLVVEATEIVCGYEGKRVIEAFSTVIMRGDKVGIIGPNGAGKTTLLRTLLGSQPPLSGEVRLGTNLEIAYFDQLRTTLDEAKTVQESVAEGNDFVTIDGRQRHIIGYLQDFLFTPDRARSPVRVLSGGERNRLLLAKLFSRPANVIVMDEPTNDLDMETLDLLEELLIDYQGTLLLVSHDRAFINNIVTSTLVFEGGGLEEYVGGYDDWLSQRKTEEKGPQAKGEKGRAGKARPRKMSFKEEKELAALPGEIERLEAEREMLCARLADPALYREGGEKVAALKGEIETMEGRLAEAYKRWEALEEIRRLAEGA